MKCTALLVASLAGLAVARPAAECQINRQTLKPSSTAATTATVGSASPLATETSKSSPVKQNACDCSKPHVDVGAATRASCPNGYENVSPAWILHCVQIDCSTRDYEAKCSSNKLATPESHRQPTKPAPANSDSGSLKPFKEPASPYNVDLCGLLWAIGENKKKKSEECIGTERFCREALYKDTEETFASPEDCLASRQPKKTAETEELPKDEAPELQEDAGTCFDALDKVFVQCRERKQDDCRKGKADEQQCKSEADEQCLEETQAEADRCKTLPDSAPGKERDPANNQ
ncbi:hypothetical protein X797_012419 [Metarhizium robertsii]|uniref:Uncharacterized protein n=2 Tax=Metarhizium robertsii TaxID=568076 RepID=E9FD12_METRA|nr:uncharacterized protein MAA_10161 [Metarhizium robertsii ARSEF 23]EFY94390.1 hypothetical protein MAA_10161 [Metarhizium robertsii ARSEF 23]EXU94510.1 hypothetical protein X797_012419 [Metarhizium robertsii]